MLNMEFVSRESATVLERMLETVFPVAVRNSEKLVYCLNDFK